MKLYRVLTAGLLLLAVSACTPSIYGVPQERWDVMTEQERIAAMEAYKERQIAYQMAAAERNRLQAEREAAEKARFEEEMRRRLERADRIYRGREGRYGDLLEVTIFDGQMKLKDRKGSYSPLTFMIADDELKAVPVFDAKGRQKDVIYVLYEDRHLWLDIDAYGRNTRRAGHLTYNPDWERGVTYSGVNSHGSRDMRNVTVSIDVLPIQVNARRRLRQPTVIVRERVVQAPPKVIVREKVVQAPPEVIVVERPVERPVDVIVREKRADRDVDRIEKKSRPMDDDRSDDEGQSDRSGRITDARQKRPAATPVPGPADDNREHSGKDEDDRGQSDRVHVELNGGKILIDGRHRPFRPVKFWIAEGESQAVVLVGHKGSSHRLKVALVNGQLYFDGSPGDHGTAVVGVGKNISTKIATKGDLKMVGVDVKVSRNRK